MANKLLRLVRIAASYVSAFFRRLCARLRAIRLPDFLRLFSFVGRLRPTVALLFFMLFFVVAIGVALCIRPLQVLSSRRTVTLKVDETSATVCTRARTVADILLDYQIVIGEGDVIYPELSSMVTDGEEILIRRAISVYIEADGETTAVSLLNGSVSKALYLGGISVDADDLVTPALDEPVTDGMTITVNRVAFTMETENQRLHYYITYQDSDELYIGQEKMVRQGEEGVKEVTMRVRTVDGVETDRTVVEEKVVQTAQNRIIAKGTKPTPTPTPKATQKPKSTQKATATATPKKKTTKTKNASEVTESSVTIDGTTYTYSETLTVTVTAYTHTGRKTSTGVWPSVGTVAVDPKVIPYGTKLYIPGYGIGVAQDCGVSGSRIDVFFDTESECTKFGRKRNVTIYVLK